jgi:hypothetical protein
LREINASLTAINISIGENEGKIGVAIKINKKVEDTKLKYIQKSRPFDQHDRLQGRAQSILNSLVSIKPIEEIANAQ